MGSPTVSEVRAIVDTSRSDIDVHGVISDASLLVEGHIGALSEDRQKAIIKWVAAHLLTSTNDNGIPTSESLGDASESYDRAPLGEFLKGTTYGQQALALDVTGSLSRVGKATATVEVT